MFRAGRMSYHIRTLKMDRRFTWTSWRGCQPANIQRNSVAVQSCNTNLPQNSGLSICLQWPESYGQRKGPTFLCSMDRASYNMAIIIQQDATIYSLFKPVNCSTCFGWYLHPSSGAHNTVSTVSGISKTVTATCRERDWAGTLPSSHANDR